MEDMFDAYIKTVCDIICKAMEDEDFEILRGIQSFDLSPWIGLRGIQAIISVIVDLCVASNPFRYGFEKRYGMDSKELGIYDKVKERFDLEKEGKITFGVLRYALGTLSNKMQRLQKLAEKGLIKIEPSGGITDDTIISLSKIWDPFIEIMIKNEIDMKIFVGSLGKMIALGLEEKGIRFLKPIIRAVNRASENVENEIPFDDFFDLYIDSGLPYYYLTLFIRSDERKNENIRLVAYRDNERIIFNKHAIRAFEIWRTVAQNYLLERRKSLRRS